MNYKGVLPSPEDKRDWKIARCMDMPTGSVTEMLPETYTVSWLPPILNQGNVSSCTAFAMSAIFSCIWHKLTGEERDFSKGFLYGNRLETSHTGKGQIMRDVAKSATKHGDLYSSTWENLTEVPEAIKAFEEAYPEFKEYAKRLVKGYVSIHTKEEAMAFLYKYDIPLFVSTKVSKISSLAALGEDGYHAIICTGYENYAWKGQEYFYNQNSWGADAWCSPKPKLQFDDYTEVWGIIPMEEKKFKDVADDRWSADAIKEAANDGIIEGFPDGTFVPSGDLTREQIAVIWQRMKRFIEENYMAKN